jgi:outer membrane protein assembly factor BamA
MAGVVAYPFSRAERVEFQGGVTRMSFDRIVQATSFSLRTGFLLADFTQTDPVASPLTLASSSAAFVHDTANFGATSPIQGQRYRLEAAPSFGSINFTSLLADYRRYLMPVSFYTIAARVMHYGRYGSGSEDVRMFPLFVGYPNLVRGYDVNSFDGRDCIPSSTSDCPALDRLVGSRMLVGNVELRFPLLRPFGVSQRMYGPVPVEVALFADGGVAWSGRTAASNVPLGLSRQGHDFDLSDGVSSAGVSLRVNFFGYAVGQFDFARPFQRPERGWLFQFNLLSGF